MAGKINIGHHPDIKITTRGGKIVATTIVVVVLALVTLSIIAALGD